MLAQEIPPKDAKSRLQEVAHARGAGLPVYSVNSRSGPPHAPEFVVTVRVGEQTGTGSAGSKRQAEQRAAANLVQIRPLSALVDNRAAGMLA